MKFIAILSLIVCTSCGGAIQRVVDSLPTIIQYVTDAQLILDRIDQSVRPLLALRNDSELNAKYAQAMEQTRAALQVALRSAKGGQHLSEDELDAAFSDFRTAYTQLREIVRSLDTLSASPSAEPIPEPLALQ